MTEIETIASANRGVTALSQDDVKAQIKAALDGLKAGIDAKPSPSAYVVSTWTSSGNWYRIYSDVWIDQGGRVLVKATTYTAQPVTLHRTFKSTNYYASVSSEITESTENSWDYAHTRTRTGFKAVAAADLNAYFYWFACGY